MVSRRNDRVGDLDADLLERPLTARSVVASLLLGRHPPAAPVSLLVDWCALFGISDTSARVALSRMVERGELSVDNAVYELVGRIRRRQLDQDFALAPQLVDWDGSWLVGVVTDSRRAAGERVRLREAMHRRRLVALREGVWVRPDNLPVAAVSADDRTVSEAQCEWWSGRPLSASSVRSATEAYALSAHDARGRALLRRLRTTTARLPLAGVLADGFVVGAASAQHLRRDPLLPAELLPARWHGDDLRAAYAEYRHAFGVAVSEWTAAR